MPRIIVLSTLSLLFLASNASAAEVSQFVPGLNAPIPVSEEILNGDVARVVFSVENAEEKNDSSEFAERESGSRNATVWEKVHFDNTVTPPKDMTFLMPQSVLRQNPKPYYRATSPTGEPYICFLVPPLETTVRLGEFCLLKYDMRGRIHDINSFDLTCDSVGTGFRYTFEYVDEENCQEARIFFRKDEGYVHKGKEIAAGEELEIGLIEFQYENDTFEKFFSNDSNYFLSPYKTELIYDERGFLTSKAQFNGLNKLGPDRTWYYRNYEQDRFGNWTRRDVYLDERLIGTYKRDIYYADEPLPDLPEDATDAENVEPDSEVKWKMDFCDSIHYLLSCAYTFCAYEFFPVEQQQ